MRRDTFLRDRRHAAAGTFRLSALFGGLLLLGGCAVMPGQTALQPPGAQPPPPADPIAAFAASAAPGAQSRVALAGGATPVRLLRSYHAASGRECREVLVGAGAAARAEIICQDEGGSWSAARPLLRGGGTQRP